MKTTHALLLLAASLAFTACSRPPAAEAEAFDLVGAMGDLQRWTDKLGRAAEVGNWPLADFYLHEIEETTKALVAAGIVYHDQPVSQLTGAMLEPAVHVLENAVKARDAELFRRDYATFVQTCNACHAATDFAFIRITAPDVAVNPWNQDFRPAP